MKVDDIICSIRELISDFSLEVDRDAELYPIVSVDNSADYNSVIDSLYLLEDTQLAKQAFFTRKKALLFGENREFNFEVRHSPMPPDGTLRIP